VFSGQPALHCGDVLLERLKSLLHARSSKNRLMKEMQTDAIHLVTDENGWKVAVQIDLVRYGEMWEDFYDAFDARAAQG